MSIKPLFGTQQLRALYPLKAAIITYSDDKYPFNSDESDEQIFYTLYINVILFSRVFDYKNSIYLIVNSYLCLINRSMLAQ